MNTKIITIFGIAKPQKVKSIDRKMSETFRPINIKCDVSGSYTDVVLLREGAMSALYRVSKGGKYFAIKTTKDNLAMQLAMLQREYDLSIKLSHYHLPHVFALEAHSPVGPGIVMEYIDGRNLNEFIAENPTLEERQRVFAQLLTVVAYIHKNGIIHNDLKPENILITHINKDVKLLDFGLSDTDAYFLTKRLGCTRNYASPELLTQCDDIDARSDIYSLGKIMKQLFPKKYRSYWQKCLQEDRDKRWDNVEQLHRSWNRARLLWRYMTIGVVAVVIITMAIYMIGVYSTEQQVLIDSLAIAREDARLAHVEANEAKSNALLTQQRLDSVTQLQQTEEMAKQRFITTRDSIVAEMKEAFKRQYDKTTQAINRVPYRDFAYQILLKYNNKAMGIKSHSLEMTSDASIRAIVVSYYDELATNYYNKLTDIIEGKKFLIDDYPSLSVEEYEFYNNLLKENKPYRKYNQ